MQARALDELAALRTPVDIHVNSELLVETEQLAVLSIEVATSSAHEICLGGRVIDNSTFDASSNTEKSRAIVVVWITPDGNWNLNISSNEFTERHIVQRNPRESLRDILKEYSLGGVYTDGEGVQPETVFSLDGVRQLTMSIRRRF